MKTKLLNTIAALAILGISASASATTIDFGDISNGDSFGASLFYSDPGIDISDTWSFTLTESLLTAIVVDSADLDPFFAIDDFAISPSSQDMSFVFDADDNRYEFAGVLPAGVYSFDVTGMTTGALGGQYEVSVGGLAPVPLPPAFWLLSAALLVLRRTAGRGTKG